MFWRVDRFSLAQCVSWENHFVHIIFAGDLLLAGHHFLCMGVCLGGGAPPFFPDGKSCHLWALSKYAYIAVVEIDFLGGEGIRQSNGSVFPPTSSDSSLNSQR